MDARVLLFALAISAVTGVLFGMAPALQATSPDLAGLDEGRRPRIERQRLAEAPARRLIVAEVALAFVLLVGSGLMMRSFFRLMNVETGFDSTNVLTHAAADRDGTLPRFGAIEPVPPRDPHRRRSRAGRARDGAELRAADAGRLLRHADAGGQPADGRSRQPRRAGSSRS